MTTARIQVGFDRDRIGHAPQHSGVYILFRGQRISFIGSDESIRAGLERHERGEGGTLTRNTTSFWFEEVGAAGRGAREGELLDEYRSEHAFNIPVGNRSAAQGSLDRLVERAVQQAVGRQPPSS